MLLAIFVTFVFALFSLSALYGCFQIKAYPHPHHLKKVKDHQGFKFQTRKKRKRKKKEDSFWKFLLEAVSSLWWGWSNICKVVQLDYQVIWISSFDITAPCKAETIKPDKGSLRRNDQLKEHYMPHYMSLLIPTQSLKADLLSIILMRLLSNSADREKNLCYSITIRHTCDY